MLTGCLGRKSEPIVVTQPQIIQQNVPIQARPKQLQLTDVRWYVVSETNLDEFIAKFKEEEGLLAFMAISAQGYENLAMDIADMRRYILQQKDIILYYEQSLDNAPDDEGIPQN
tara:strand:- start:48 stop:389 length:342 start_codon:yes stop_codon:yes gene_type:complete